MEEKDIDLLFTYHTAPNIDPERFVKIRETAKSLGKTILACGREEQDIKRAILKLRECVFYAIASLAIPYSKE